MTTASTNLNIQGFFARLAQRLSAGFEAHARAMSRRAEIERLEAKSDAELAQMGLKREEIARRVFGDLFYA